MKLFIKYMVSDHCKMMVQSELDKLGLNCLLMDLGEVVIKEHINVKQRTQLKIALLKAGFELMSEKKTILLEKIKKSIVKMVDDADNHPKTNFSDYISSDLDYDYTYLANLFSEVTGTTIEHFMIMCKIEQVKELLIYDELSLTKIAVKLKYSSVAHLSNQFRQVTGLTPSFFKQLKLKRFISTNNV